MYYYILILIITIILILLLLFFIIQKTKSNLEEKMEKIIKEEIINNRKEINENLKINREELHNILQNNFETINQSINEVFKNINKKFDDSFKLINEMLRENREELNHGLKNNTELLLKQIQDLTITVENKLKQIQEDNNLKLEKMRETVDEKLHSTLEKRLNDSFKLVTDKLESVQKGFGEMQHLAASVGDLKKAMTNIKVRGGWGEIQLERIISDYLTPDQYEKNIILKEGTNNKIEFAIKFPGKSEESFVFLPIDAKFPKEDYEKMFDALEKCDNSLYEIYSKNFENRIKSEAKDICEKYISPPKTLDFGIMFLPTEGLYSEVARRPGLIDEIQNKFRVIIAGPINLAALLMSLQIGFKTLVIQKRTSEVWQMLETIKSEFSNFGRLLEKTKQKIEQAGKELENASKKTQTIEKKLNNISKLELDKKNQTKETYEISNDTENGQILNEKNYEPF